MVKVGFKEIFQQDSLVKMNITKLGFLVSETW